MVEPSAPYPIRAPSPELLARIRDIVGPKGVVTEREERAPYLTEWRNRFDGDTPMVVLPASTQEVAAVVAACAAEHAAITPQGGNTGLVGGQIPFGGEIVISCKRMNRVLDVSPLDNTMTVEAGVVLQTAQQEAADVDRLFPLSLGAEGTAVIGGVISTNAGGVNVLRYGNMRDLVLGLEVVLADGRIWNGLRRLRKDNTGYDLKHLFIGAEGTLGIVTKAVLKLFPAPKDRVTAFIGMERPEQAVALLSLMQDATGGMVSGFELISARALSFVLKHIPNTRNPLAGGHPWHVLFEATAGRDAGLREIAETALGEAIESGLASDAVIAENARQADDFWRIRHSIAEAQRPEGSEVKHDVSVPVASIPAYLEKADAAIEAAYPGVRIVAFGHLGDGNIHYDLAQPEGGDRDAFIAQRDALSRIVHDIAAEFSGSISAEHGLGRLKAGEILRYKDETEMDLMRRVKAALDPDNMMNPGKVLAPPR